LWSGWGYPVVRLARAHGGAGVGSALARTLIRHIFQSRRGSRAGGVGHQRADHKELKWPEGNKIGDSFQHSLSASLEIGKDKYINLINTQLKIFLN